MKKKRRSSKKNSSAKLWVVTLLLIGLLAIILIYLQKQNPPVHAKHKTEHKKITTKIKPTTEQQPKFDFYTVLPQAKNNSPPPANFGTLQTPVKKQSLVSNPQSTAKNNSKEHFVLQIAAVKNYADADRLKAELTLLGYNVSIEKVIKKNITWNRVNLGPYPSLQAAKTAQAELEKKSIKSILTVNS